MDVRKEVEMNIYDCGDDVFKLNLWNLNADNLDLAGHLRIWWDRASDKYVMGIFGGFGGLTWYPELKISLGFPTDNQDLFLRPMLEERLNGACFYDGDKIHGYGEFLTETMRKREMAGEYVKYMKVWHIFERFKPDSEEIGVDDTAKRMLKGV
jgi:hypothetical protein